MLDASYTHTHTLSHLLSPSLHLLLIIQHTVLICRFVDLLLIKREIIFEGDCDVIVIIIIIIIIIKPTKQE